MSKKTHHFRLAGLTAALIAAGMITAPMAFATTPSDGNTSTPPSTPAPTFSFAQASIAGAMQISSDLSVSAGEEDPNNTTVNGNAMRGATGNVGLNTLSGSNNAQANVATINNGNGNSHFAFTGAIVSQGIDNLWYEQEGGYPSSNHTTMTGNALRGATGNVGVNSAAGDANQQANALAVLNGHKTAFAMAGSMVHQDISDSGQSGDGSLEGTNTTTFSGNALRGATGNIGVNLATGQGNQQGNAAAISRTKTYTWETESGSIVDQDLWDNGVTGAESLNGQNTTSIKGNALRGATGNVGVNAVSGQNNQQANALVINNGSKGEAEGVGMVFQHNIGSSDEYQEDYSTNRASVSGNALRGATGNVGVNVGSGRFNQQANATMVANSDHSFVFGQGNLSVQGNIGVTSDNDGTNNASMAGNALRGATGNVGANVVAGTANSQGNSLQVVKAKSLAGVAAGGAVQYQLCNSSYNDGTNTTSLGDNVLRGATGNVGVNMAAGSSNLQSNVMTIATLK